VPQLAKVVKLAISPSVRWLVFFTAIALAWALLYAMQWSASGYEAVFGADFWTALCIADVSLPSLFGMWVLMAGAMMAPTAIPMLKTYDDLKYAGAGTSAGFWALLAGYLLIWIGFALIAALLQKQLFDARLVNIKGASLSPLLSAGLLAVAGLYQFSKLKNACLTACQAPLMSFMGRWKPGTMAAFNMGLKEGLNCLGCCWALMLLGFVGGTMNLAFMGLGMALMILEKLPQIGRYISKPLGFALLAASLFTLITT
jgi:predicted metal-binding membrane protein